MTLDFIDHHFNTDIVGAGLLHTFGDDSSQEPLRRTAEVWAQISGQCSGSFFRSSPGQKTIRVKKGQPEMMIASFKSGVDGWVTWLKLLWLESQLKLLELWVPQASPGYYYCWPKRILLHQCSCFCLVASPPLTLSSEYNLSLSHQCYITSWDLECQTRQPSVCALCWLQSSGSWALRLYIPEPNPHKTQYWLKWCITHWWVGLWLSPGNVLDLLWRPYVPGRSLRSESAGYLLYPTQELQALGVPEFLPRFYS